MTDGGGDVARDPQFNSQNALEEIASFQVVASSANQEWTTMDEEGTPFLGYLNVVIH